MNKKGQRIKYFGGLSTQNIWAFLIQNPFNGKKHIQSNFCNATKYVFSLNDTLLNKKSCKEDNTIFGKNDNNSIVEEKKRNTLTLYFRGKPWEKIPLLYGTNSMKGSEVKGCDEYQETL